MTTYSDDIPPTCCACQTPLGWFKRSHPPKFIPSNTSPAHPSLKPRGGSPQLPGPSTRMSPGHRVELAALLTAPFCPGSSSPNGRDAPKKPSQSHRDHSATHAVPRSVSLSSFWVASVLPCQTKLPTEDSRGPLPHLPPSAAAPFLRPPYPLIHFPPTAEKASPLALQTSAPAVPRLCRALPKCSDSTPAFHQPDTQVGETTLLNISPRFHSPHPEEADQSLMFPTTDDPRVCACLSNLLQHRSPGEPAGPGEGRWIQLPLGYLAALVPLGRPPGRGAQAYAGT